jgi:hypothetical protein
MTPCERERLVSLGLARLDFNHGLQGALVGVNMTSKCDIHLFFVSLEMHWKNFRHKLFLLDSVKCESASIFLANIPFRAKYNPDKIEEVNWTIAAAFQY